MTENELLFEMRKPRRLLAEANERQKRCTHSHDCHVVFKVSEAEALAYELEHEIEIQQGERLIAASR